MGKLFESNNKIWVVKTSNFPILHIPTFIAEYNKSTCANTKIRYVFCQCTWPGHLQALIHLKGFLLEVKQILCKIYTSEGSCRSLPSSWTSRESFRSGSSSESGSTMESASVMINSGGGQFSVFEGSETQNIMKYFLTSFFIPSR